MSGSCSVGRLKTFIDAIAGTIVMAEIRLVGGEGIALVACDTHRTVLAFATLSMAATSSACARAHIPTLR